jgi:hypothetical protein
LATVQSGAQDEMPVQQRPRFTEKCEQFGAHCPGSARGRRALRGGSPRRTLDLIASFSRGI